MAELVISMFYVKYDTFTQWLSYSSAGHNNPVLYRISDAQCMMLDSEGMILGVKDDVVFEDRSILLDPWDILLLYTDGLTETSNSEGEMFGIERLSTFLSEMHEEPLQLIIDTIYREVINFAEGAALSDDISIVAMRVEHSFFDQED